MPPERDEKNWGIANNENLKSQKRLKKDRRGESRWGNLKKWRVRGARRKEREERGCAFASANSPAVSAKKKPKDTVCTGRFQMFG